MTPISFEEIDDEIYNYSDFNETSFTYKIKYSEDKIKEYIDGINAVKQAVYKILSTEKGKYQIYDSEYGITLSDLFGKSAAYAKSELPARIEKALLYDGRIKKVYDFSFPERKEKGILPVRFYISSVFGEEEVYLEVEV